MNKYNLLTFIKSALKLARRQGDTQRFKVSQLRRILPYLKSHWIKASLATGFLIIVSLVTLPTPWLLKILIDEVFVKGDASLLNILVLSMIGLQLVKVISTFLMDYFFTVLNQDILVSIQKDLFRRMLKLPLYFFDKNQTGYLVSRIREVTGLGVFFSSSLLRLFIGLITFIASLIILIKLSWKLTLIAIVFLPLYYLVVKFFSRGLKASTKTVYEKAAIVSKEIQESLSGISVIKAFAKENLQTQKIKGSLKSYRHSSILQSIFFSISSEIIFLITAVAGFVLLWFCSREILAANFTIGKYFAFSGYVGKMYAPINQLASLALVFQPAIAALMRISELFEHVTEEEDKQRTIRIDRLNGDIRFENVSFSYDQDTEVLKNISFHIEPSQAVAFVGPSGSGKTTIIRLIMGFYSHQQGRILVDGYDIKSLVLSDLRERIGMVSQNIFLFNDTIKNNIRYGNQEATDEDVKRAAEIAGAHAFVESLPLGYETIVGEGGGMMSGGEIQRIAIARTIINNPDILILDEATSSVDVNTEKKIREDINHIFKGKTQITITHRLEAIDSAERIFVLDKSQVKESNKCRLINTSRTIRVK